MTGPLYRIGRVCSSSSLARDRRVDPRRRSRSWSSSNAAGEQNSDNLSLPGTDSKRASGPALVGPPEAGLRHQPDRARRRTSGKLTDSKYKKPIDDTVDSLKKTDHVIRVVSPLGQRGRERAQQGQDDRLHLGDPRRGPERPHGGRGRDDHRRGRPGQGRRPRRVRRRLPRQRGVEGRRGQQRADRHRRRGDHPAVRVRHGHGDGRCRSSPRSSGSRRRCRSSACSATWPRCRTSPPRSRR